MDNLREFALSIFRRTPIVPRNQSLEPQRNSASENQERRQRSRENRRMIRINEGFEISSTGYLFTRRHEKDGSVREEELQTWKRKGVDAYECDLPDWFDDVFKEVTGIKVDNPGEMIYDKFADRVHIVASTLDSKSGGKTGEIDPAILKKFGIEVGFRAPKLQSLPEANTVGMDPSPK